MTINQARRILGSEGKGLDDEQIEELLRQLNFLAEIAAMVLKENPKWKKKLAQ